MGRPARSAGPGLLSVLLGAVGAGPLLLYGLSATSDRIIGDLGIDEVQFGLLATVCFGCAAVGNATLGRLADRHRDLPLMTIVFLLAIAALVLVSVPAGYWLLLVAVGLSGLAQSFPNGVTNRILLERVPLRAESAGWGSSSPGFRSASWWPVWPSRCWRWPWGGGEPPWWPR